MSRHSRQRNKRFRKALESVCPGSVSACIWRWTNTGKTPLHYTPIVRIAAMRQMVLRNINW